MQNMNTYAMPEETLEALQEVFGEIESATDLLSFALADIDTECGRKRANALLTVSSLLDGLYNKGYNLLEQIARAHAAMDPGQIGRGQL